MTMVLPKEERSRVETWVDNSDSDLHLHPTTPTACRFRHCHLLVVALPIYNLQGTNATHHDELSVIPLFVACIAHLHCSSGINEFEIQLTGFATRARPRPTKWGLTLGCCRLGGGAFVVGFLPVLVSF